MNGNKVGKITETQGIRDFKDLGGLSIKVWHVVLEHLNERDLGRVRSCCRLFNEDGEGLLKNLWDWEMSRVMSDGKNPLQHIFDLDYRAIRKIRGCFSYVMRHVVLSDELFRAWYSDPTFCSQELKVSRLFALFDLDNADRDNVLWLSNSQKIKSVFNWRFWKFDDYWRYVERIIIEESYATDVVCNYFSLLEDVLKEELGGWLLISFFINVIKGSSKNPSDLLQLRLKNVIKQIIIYESKAGFVGKRIIRGSIEELSESGDEAVVAIGSSMLSAMGGRNLR